MPQRARKHWGWGYADEQPAPAELAAQAQAISSHLGFGAPTVEEPVPLERVSLAAPRLCPPAKLAEICRDDVHARASHALGKSYRDVVLGMRGRFEHPPDVVALPGDERELEAVLEWCAHSGAVAIPFGGGTSVVGGVEPRLPSGTSCNGVVSIDISRLGRVLEVDVASRAARIQAGAMGPALEAELAKHGLTLRHFPQSFQFSTLGGWIATRAGGHFATRWTHIEDLVESLRAITPSGVWESRRLPGSGAGPSPDRLLAGSEGILGVITEAWMRVRPRPSHRAQAAVRLPSFAIGVECAQALSQADLDPANCRLVDPLEAALTGAGDGSHALLLLGFESSDHDVGGALKRALEICAAQAGEWDAVERREPEDARGGGGSGNGGGIAGNGGGGGDGGASGATSAWRDTFLRVPYVRDTLAAIGVIAETFETAITWDRVPALHEAVLAAARGAVEAQTGAGIGAQPGQARVSCRFTHVYPDGAALYFTVLAPARRGEEIEQWDAIKRSVSDAILAAGGTITHHHAVGRDHRPWYDRQRPEPFAAALRGAKAAVDPLAIMNPGVLVDPLAVGQ
ncbi:MAG TPA: FAD-binding oxidoreductase [Solirubrobacteraceae bacterium]